jgi:uncharacterized membrane protein YfcA
VAVIDLDADALRKGIAVAAVITIPIALASWIWIDDESTKRQPVIVVFSLIVIGGLILGAALAAQLQRTGTPLAHGIVTVLVVWAVLSIVRLVRLTVAGDDLDVRGLVSNLLISLIAGTVGGLIGGRGARPAEQRGGRCAAAA